MKTSYIFGAILGLGILGILVGARAAKNACLLATAAFALYGLVRLLG